MTNLVDTGIAYFNDPNRGRPIYRGYIYVGEPDTDPSDIPNNLKDIQVRTADGNTLAVSQPLRTNSGGNPEYNGESVQILTEGSYSLLVQDNARRDKIYIRNAFLGKLITTLDLASDGIYTWQSAVTYSNNDYSIGSDGEIYKSVASSNTGNDPVLDDGSNWNLARVFELGSLVELAAKQNLQVGEVYNSLGGLTKGDRGEGNWLCTSTTINESSLPGATDQTLGSVTVKWHDGFLHTPTGTSSIWNKLEFCSDTVNVISFGAAPDDATDSTIAIQQAVLFAARNASQPIGGGKVYFPRGIYRTNSPIEVYSDVRLEGEHWTNTYIKPLDFATFSENEAVVQTLNFPTVQGTNEWDYYPSYPAGLVMGFGIDHITIDGNRNNVSNAGGLNVYGGKWTFGTIGVINCDSHCIWTEAGVPNDSTSGDDFHDWLNMHESSADVVFICNSSKHGWLYRGPNDSNINDVQVKTCQWGGFVQESTGNNSVGNLEITSLHAYSCNCNHDADGAMITLANANAQFVYVDASLKNGLRLNNSATIIDEVLILKNNENNAGAFYGVIVDVAAQINMIRNAETSARTSGTNGGVLQINADGTVVGHIRSSQAAGTTIPENVVQANSQCIISDIVAASYDTGGSVVELNSSRCRMYIDANNCSTALTYNAAGRNNLVVNAFNCGTDVDFAVPAANTDIISVQSNNATRSTTTVGKVSSVAINREINTVGSTSLITPNMESQSLIRIISLATNLTVNAPTNVTDGDVLDFYIQQDSIGGRSITFDSSFFSNYTNTGNSSFQRLWIKFVYDGSGWVMSSNTGWY